MMTNFLPTMIVAHKALQAAAVVHQTQPHEAGLHVQSSGGDEAHPFIYHHDNKLDGFYTGGDDWEMDSCNAADKSSTQSPIDLPAQFKGNATLSGISGSWGSLSGCSVKNTGHSYNIQGCKDMESKKFEWGNEAYTLAQVHIHSKSEHTIGGKRSFLEMHMVHLNSDKSKAAVVGTLFDVSKSASSTDNLALAIFLNDAVKNAPNEKDVVQVSGEMPLDFLNGKQAYHYHGGLTTPPCSAIVEWFVVSEPQSISQSQANAIFSQNAGAYGGPFSGLLGTQNQGPNYRNLVAPMDTAGKNLMHGRVTGLVGISAR